jgi:glucosylglycerate phosphorylase
MSERIYELLDSLYPEDQSADVYERLIQRIEQARQSVQADLGAELYSERDVVLITYGDSLKEAGQRPLQTLRAFTESQLAEVFSAIHILPFYPYSSDDGFSVKDFYSVNPDLGTWDDVRELGAHFDLMYDAVLNHMSAQSEWFRRFLADDPDYHNLFMTASPDDDLSAVVRPRTSPLLTPYEKDNGETVHVWTTFSADQIDFDPREPNTVLRLLDILLFYVEQGARIIRLDAIAFLWKEIGTTCLHLPQTHAIIQLMRAVLDEVAPQVILITETNVPHRENISYFGDGAGEAQLVYNFTLPPLMLHTMLSGDTARLREWINTLDTPSDRTTFFNFTASHDGIGVRPVEGILRSDELQTLIDHTLKRGGRVSYRHNPDGSSSPYELNITYVDAMIDPVDPQELQVRRFLVSQAVMLSLAGVPAVYIHSLLGSHNNIEGMQQPDSHNRTINRARLNAPELYARLADSGSFRAQVFNRYRDLIRIRAGQPAFHPNAKQQAIDPGNHAVLVLRREYQGQRVTCLFNVTGMPQPVSLSLSGTDLITGQRVSQPLQLEPYQVMWIQEH